MLCLARRRLRGLSLRFSHGGGCGWLFLAAVAVILLALVSPLSALADGYLFSAHMVQHILLLLIVPALLLLSSPASFWPYRETARPRSSLAGWLAGVGAMWLWHAPALCNAAVTSRPVHAFKRLAAPARRLFWWQVLAPREEERLSPLGACPLSVQRLRRLQRARDHPHVFAGHRLFDLHAARSTVSAC